VPCNTIAHSYHLLMQNSCTGRASWIPSCLESEFSS
jgi:hypothetical protein